ncbi:MAG TPA: hypothetical protein VM223_23215 [Planctomycetota bacterium]|nr:hypothetical protein [Planctomycetota bacterium]
MDLLTREQRDKLPSSLALMVAGGVSGKVGGVTTQLPSASERVERAERLLGQQQTRAHEAKMYPLQERTAQVGLAAARLGLKGQRKTVREADEIDSLIGLVSAGQATPLTIPRLRQLDKDTADVAQKWTDLKQAEDDEHAIAAYSVTASKEQLDEPSIFDWTRRMIRQGYSQQDIQENQALGRAAPEDKGNYFPPDMKATTFKMAQLSAQRAEIEHGWQEERVIREGQRFAAEMRRGAINDHKSAMAHFDARVAAAQQSGRAMTPWEIAALEQIANMTFEALPVYAGPEQKAVGAAPGTTSFRVGEVPKERSRARGGGGGGGGTAKPGKKDRGTYLGGYTVMLHGPYKLSGQTFRVSYGWANEESILISTPTGNMTVPKGYYEVMTGAQTSAAKTTAAIRAQQAGYGAGGGGGGKYTIEDAVNDLGGPK